MREWKRPFENKIKASVLTFKGALKYKKINKRIGPVVKRRYLCRMLPCVYCVISLHLPINDTAYH